jgi:hypothetical protein
MTAPDREDQELAGRFIEMLAAEKGAAENTRLAYGRDLDDFLTFLAGRQKSLTAVAAADISCSGSWPPRASSPTIRRAGWPARSARGRCPGRSRRPRSTGSSRRHVPASMPPRAATAFGRCGSTP